VKHSGVGMVLISAAAVVMASIVTISAQFGPIGPGAGPADPNAQFEAASIKPVDPSFAGTRMMIQPGRMEMTGAPVRLLLRQAFRVQEYQIVGAPDWTTSERYSIVAKAPDGSSPANMPAMVMNLLKDRFKLASHTESREMPVFNLVLARSDGRLGAKLTTTSAECQAQMQARRGGGPGRPGGPGPGGPDGPGRAGGPPPPIDFNQPMPCGNTRIGPGLANASGQPIAQIVQLLAQFTGRPVFDKTALTGLYDFDLKWAPESGAGGPLGPPPPGAPVPAIDPDAPNIYTAVQEQLGLKLENARAPVDVVVIDRLERPSLD
jgi:uncharacterized protein (TIGR03435 family)